MSFFVGIDWGSKNHTVCVVDADGKTLLEEEIAHRGDAVLAFIDRLLRLADNDATRIVAAMESPHGVMVEALLERDVATYSINPKQLDRFRDRHSGAGAKDDDLDAYVLATSLRTDLPLFRKIALPSAERMQLGALSRSYEAITEQVVSLSNQVREQLVRYYPQMLELGDWHNQPWLWDLFEVAPTPAHAKRLSPAKVRAILSDNRIRRHNATAVLETLRQTALPVAVGVPEAVATRIQMLLPILRASHQQRAECSRKMNALFSSFQEETDSPEKTHHDAALLLSLPGIGVHNGAVMLTEANSALQQRDYQALRRLAGVAPVSKRTGGRSKRPIVERRQACNHRLREAMYHWGRVAAQYDQRTRQHYADLRARGHSHGRAIRGVVDRLLKVLLAVLKSGSPYDPSRRIAGENLAPAI
jgi:transposase